MKRLFPFLLAIPTNCYALSPGEQNAEDFGAALATAVIEAVADALGFETDEGGDSD